MESNVNKILVVRVGRVGDIVMITPALGALFEKYPEAEVHVLTSLDGVRVLKGFHERLTRIIVYDRTKLNGVFERRRIKKQINDERYFCIYCFELKPSFHKLFESSAAKKHILDDSCKDLHYAQRCLKVVDDEVEGKWIYLPVSDAGKEKAQALLQSEGIAEDSFIIGFHPSFSGMKKSFFRSRKAHHFKEWPVMSFATLAILLCDYAGQYNIRLNIIMDLLPDEKALGVALVEASGNKVRLLMPPPDFERYKAVMQRMDLLITPDTGPMHIAGAVGTSIVALFSGKSPNDCGPYVPPEQYVTLRAEDTDEPDKGLAAISPEAVFEMCKRFFPMEKIPTAEN